MEGQDQEFFKYIEYFQRMPQMQQYYMLVGKSEGSVNAKEVSEKVHRSIQTVTNALRALEREGLLKSKKEGRTRYYQLRDPRLFQGIIQQYTAQKTYRQPKEDFVSEGIFKENLEKWLRYLSRMLQGKMYVHKFFRTHILDIPVDYVIENKNGQSLIVIFDIHDELTLQAAIGKLLSIISSKDIIPNISVLFSVVLVPIGMDLNTITDAFRKISELSRKFDVLTHYMLKTINAGDLAKEYFSITLSQSITEFLPVPSLICLSTDLLYDTPSEKRLRALKAIQQKINVNTGNATLVLGRTDINSAKREWRKLLPRDEEVKKWIDPKQLLISSGLSKGNTFVDMGCFEGLFTLPATQIVGEKGLVYGVEVTPNAIAKLQSIIDQSKIKNIILKNDFPENVVLDEKNADIVFFGATVIESFDPLALFKKAYSTLKESGKLVILEWTVESLGTGPVARIEPNRMKEYLEVTGFNVELTRKEGEKHYLIIASKIKDFVSPQVTDN